MDFNPTANETRLRDEIRAWLKDNLDPRFQESRGVPNQAEHHAYSIDFNKRLANKGWLVPAWPKEYGGGGYTPMEYAVTQDELCYARAPIGMNIIRSGHAGPTIIVHGTEEQRRQHIPPIARAEVIWCQGFSEPGSGSDLASLQTRAVRDGDNFIINGQKIWTSIGHLADMCILLARTNPEAPKHKGITCFLLDMKSPGIEVRPIRSLDGGHHFNEVFFNDVVTPVSSALGEVDRGWYVATTQLDFERSAASRVGSNRRMVQDLVTLARERGVMKSTVRNALADLAVASEVGRLLCYRVAAMQTRGLIPNSEASMGKLMTCELSAQIARVGVSLLGLEGQRIGHDSGGHRYWANEYLGAVSATIAGGTSEVQRNILATRGLGLPRG